MSRREWQEVIDVGTHLRALRARRNLTEASMRQELKLNLEGTVLSVAPINRNGNSSRPYFWEIRKSGKLPSSLFFLLRKFVGAEVRNAKGQEMRELRLAVKKGLRDAAAACGCDCRFRRKIGGLTFYLEGQPLIVFVVTGKNGKSRSSEALLNSKAIFRWVVKVHENGYFTFIPKDANSKWSA